MDQDRAHRARGALQQLHDNRRRAVQLHQDGQGIMRIATLTGLSYPSVRKAIALFEAGGWDALQPAARGRVARLGRLLDTAQEATLRQAIYTQMPPDPQQGALLWSTQAVVDHSLRHLGVALSGAAVDALLASWGLALPRPAAYAQDATLARWMARDYPTLRRQAQARGAAIYWLLTRKLEPLDGTAQQHGPTLLAAIAARAPAQWQVVPALAPDALACFAQSLADAAPGARLLLLVPHGMPLPPEAALAVDIVRVPSAPVSPRAAGSAVPSHAAEAAPLAANAVAPRAERKRLAERALISAAIKVIGEKGVPGLTLAEVATRAGFTKTLVSHHFGSRDELVLRILVHLRENFGQRAARSEANGLQALLAFLGTFEQEFATPSRHVDLYTAVLASALFESHAFALEIDRINAFSLDFIRECLRYEEARGATFLHGDLQATAEYIFCCVRGLMLVHGLKRRVRADAGVAGALDVTRRIIASSIVRLPQQVG